MARDTGRIVMRTDGDDGLGEVMSRYHRAVAMAARLVEGSMVAIPAEDADVLHDPLVAEALAARGVSDPAFAAKLAGRHGAWLSGAWDGDAGGARTECQLAIVYAMTNRNGSRRGFEAPGVGRATG